MHAPSFFQPLTSTDPAAIAIVRAVGSGIPDVCRRLLRFQNPIDWESVREGSVRRAQLVDPDIGTIDDIVVSIVSRPGADSSDKRWELWLHLHGGPGIIRRCCELLEENGLDRASGTLETPFVAADRIELECLSLLPEMKSHAGVRWLLSQAEKVNRLLPRLRKRAAHQPNLVKRACKVVLRSHVVFEWFSRPMRIALIGPPNVGKSTLMNVLAGAPVSMTSEVAGTTRDWVEAPGEISGFPVVWIDTAGIHESDDPLDQAGIGASLAVASGADLRVGVFDASGDDIGSQVGVFGGPTIDVLIFNKGDLLQNIRQFELVLKKLFQTSVCVVSAVKGYGLTAISSELLRRMGRDIRKLQRATAFSAAVAREFSQIAESAEL